MRFFTFRRAASRSASNPSWGRKRSLPYMERGVLWRGCLNGQMLRLARRRLSDEALQLAGGGIAGGNDATTIRGSLYRLSVQSHRPRRSPVSSYADADGFVEVAEAPTGFMVIKRHVFKLMMEKYPELNYVPDGPPNNPQRHLYWRFFDCMIDPEFRTLSLRRLHLLPALARLRRQGVR